MLGVALYGDIMKKLFIIGAGDFGREVLEWALAMPACGRDWRIAGFLDSRGDVLKGLGVPMDVVGSPSTWIVQDDHVFVCALGDPVQRMKYARLILERGGRFINIIHPTVIIGLNSKIGQGCILCPYATVTVNVTLGDFVVLNLYASVGHDATLGEGSTLSAHCDVTGHVRLGECVFLGSHASVLPKAVVEDFAVVGAGSVVLRKVSAHATVLGVPARVVMTRKGGTNE